MAHTVLPTVLPTVLIVVFRAECANTALKCYIIYGFQSEIETRAIQNAPVACAISCSNIYVALHLRVG